MNEFQQAGYGQQQYSPFGVMGGGFPGQGGVQGWGGISQGAQPFGGIGQMGQGFPMLQPTTMQYPLLAQHLMQQYPLLQQAMMNPLAAQQVGAQHPLFQQAMQHPLMALQILQQHPLFLQAVQQYLLQQLQQIQQQQQFQQPGIGGQQGWAGAGIGTYGQPMGLDPYSAWLQQQSIASQFRGMPAFQSGQMGAFPGQPGIQPGGQTVH